MPMSEISLELIKRALALHPFDSLGAQLRMTPSHRAIQRPESTGGRPRLSAVILLVYRRAEEWHVLLTRRRDDLNSHAGQISFPGGSREADESLPDTALRETQEEVGLTAEGIQLLGELATVYIPPSDFEVHPFVACHVGPARFLPDPAEVAELLETPLRLLLDPDTRQVELWELRDMHVEVPFYRIGSHKVWGATAMILGEFLERLRAAIAVEAEDR